MRVGAAYKIRTVAVVFIAALVAGCAGRPTKPPQPAPPPAPVASAPEQPRPPVGRAFQIVPAESLLTVQVYKGGALARAGHNHVVASHGLNGVAHVPEDVTAAQFEVHVPVNDFTVDETSLRTQAGADFPGEVPEDAKQGTRRNMLGAALLDGVTYPEIIMRSTGIERTAEGLQAQVQILVKDQVRSLAVPLRYQLNGNELQVAGEFPLKQTDIGLTPFTLFGGALRVLDELKVSFQLVARADAAP
jgi:hypothetical protein